MNLYSPFGKSRGRNTCSEDFPVGCWPAVLRDEHAAAYVDEKTVEAFLSRVGTIWPKPFIETGTGKGRFRAWRKIDLDKAIGGNVESEQWEVL
jgi:hypothetical protein